MEKSLQTLNRQEKIAVWSDRIAACRSSGISVRAWCSGLNPYRYLLRVLECVPKLAQAANEAWAEKAFPVWAQGKRIR